MEPWLAGPSSVLMLSFTNIELRITGSLFKAISDADGWTHYGISQAGLDALIKFQQKVFVCVCVYVCERERESNLTYLQYTIDGVLDVFLPD